MDKIDILIALMVISVIVISHTVITYNFIGFIGWIIVILLSISIIESNSNQR